MMVDVHSGFAPPEWQSFVGPVLAYRPQHHHLLGSQKSIFQSDIQHFNKLDGEIVWDFISTIMMALEKTKIPMADIDFGFEKLRDYTENYCLSNTGLSQNYQGTEGQNITLGAF